MLHLQRGYLWTVLDIAYLEADIPPLYFHWNAYSHLQKERETVIAGLVLMHLDGQTSSQNGNNADVLLRRNEIVSV